MTKKATFITLACLITCMGITNARSPKPIFYKQKVEAPKNPIMKVVMVHGFMETGNSFKSMKRHLNKEQIACQIVQLKPANGRGGLEKLAKDLKKQIDAQYGEKEPISLIGFSMGGLVGRYYLQELGGADRCQAFMTISSPHQGTKIANLYSSKGVRQMRPGSTFLQKLDNSEDKLGDIPVVSYRTRLDLVILPADNSIWERAENVEYSVLLHPMMVTSYRVISDIRERLLKIAS